jgi:hypothetical protein
MQRLFKKLVLSYVYLAIGLLAACTNAQPLQPTTTQHQYTGGSEPQNCNIRGTFSYVGEQINLLTGVKRSINQLQFVHSSESLPNALYFDYSWMPDSAIYVVAIKNEDHVTLKEIKGNGLKDRCVDGKLVYNNTSQGVGDGNPSQTMAKSVIYLDSEGALMIRRWQRTEWSWPNNGTVSEYETLTRFPRVGGK